MISGCAAPDGTRAWLDQHPQVPQRSLGKTGLQVSAAGFGCYRVETGNQEHRAALRLALMNGINVVDTSANYADGGSERLVGEVLQELIEGESLRRESVVVVSKGGYLQGGNLLLSAGRREAGRPFPDLVEYAAGLEHCIHPEFLEEQLTRSLSRLGLETLDVYLLHNPEYFLGWASKHGVPIPAAREEYYRRIQAAFEHLESEVRRGRIRWYGISSNTLPHPAPDPEFTSLASILQIAASVEENHHFRVVQLPMNLLETGGATEANQPDGSSVLELCAGNGIGVLVNRPLNALAGNGMMRLADRPLTALEPSPAVIEERIRELAEIENEFETEILEKLPATEAVRSRLLETLRSAAILEQNWRQFQSSDQWLEVQAKYLVPRVQGVTGALLEVQGAIPGLLDWLSEYVGAANAAHQAIGAFQDAKDRGIRAAIGAAATSVEPEWSASKLSHVALRSLRSTTGIDVVLVGMRQVEYVRDVLEELSRPIDVRPRAGAWKGLKARFAAGTL